MSRSYKRDTVGRFSGGGGTAGGRSITGKRASDRGSKPALPPHRDLVGSMTKVTGTKYHYSRGKR